MAADTALLPLLDMGRLPAAAFGAALYDSFRAHGFALVTGHGIDAGLIARGWAQCRALFALPDKSLRAYAVPGGAGQRGYTPFRTEVAKDATEPDLKAFWHIGRDLPPGSASNTVMPPNVWPAELPEFAATLRALYAALDTAGARMLAALTGPLGLASDWFDDALRDGNSVLRLLHYPPVAPDAPGVRAGAHEDINLLTLLLGAEEAGLELLTRDGRWLAVEPPPGALVVNVGDMLQRLTNHVLPSTTHRVVNPHGAARDRSRYAMPFFLHLRPDFVIRPLPGCVSAANPARHPPITADAYLKNRLAEIGLV